jgi:hypothetical protein
VSFYIFKSLEFWVKEFKPIFKILNSGIEKCCQVFIESKPELLNKVATISEFENQTEPISQSVTQT